MHLKKQDTTYAMAYTTAYFVKRRDNMAKTREATVEICIATLTDICTDTEARDADRIAAAKLLMDICQDKGEAAGELKIILKDMPGEYLK